MKYIIELEDAPIRMKNSHTGEAYNVYKAKEFRSLVFDVSGLHKLERYDTKTIVHEAYQRGYEAGLAEGRKQGEDHDGCNGCFYEPRGVDEEPCKSCKCCYMDHYERANNEIRVGDIVEIKETDIEIWVTGVFDDGESINGIAIYDCDDNCDAGDTYSGLKKNRLKKTGKHYPMEKLLEAMKK